MRCSTQKPMQKKNFDSRKAVGEHSLNEIVLETDPAVYPLDVLCDLGEPADEVCGVDLAECGVVLTQVLCLCDQLLPARVR